MGSLEGSQSFLRRVLKGEKSKRGEGRRGKRGREEVGGRKGRGGEWGPTCSFQHRSHVTHDCNVSKNRSCGGICRRDLGVEHVNHDAVIL